MVNLSPSTATLHSTAELTTASTLAPARGTQNGWSREDLLPAISGLMMGLAFEPTNLVFLAFVGLVPLLVYLDRPLSKKRILRASFIFPIACYGFTLNWLAGMVAYSWLSVPGYVVILFVYCCGFFVFTLPVVFLKQYLRLPFFATAPFAWVACERLRGYGDLAFPWSNLGCSLSRFPLLVQFADVVGVFGVSFWLIVLNVLMFEIISSRRRPSHLARYAVAWVVVFGSVMAYDGWRWHFGIGQPLGYKDVAVIQPNIAQKVKWDEHYSRQILDHVFSMDRAATKPSTDLMIWPETAIPYYIDEKRPFHLTEMGPLPAGNTPIVSGLLTYSRDSGGHPHYFNAAALFDSRGNMLGLYKKIYLVPGSEQYPFRNLLGFTRAFFSIQDISYGAMDAGQEFTVFQIPGAKFSVMICYESVYPQLARAFRLAGANFLVNITNDAWFGHSFAPYQHASFLTLRAIENRTAIVRCGNTGISGFVDPWGRWQQKTAIFTETIISQRVPVTDNLTFYTRHGDLIIYICYAAMGLFLIMALRKKFLQRSDKETQ